MSDGIDYHKSLSSGRLVFGSRISETLDALPVVLVGIGLFVAVAFLFLNVQWDRQNDQIVGFVFLPILFCFTVAFVYRRLTDCRLTEIATSLSRRRNREFVTQFMREKGYAISVDNSQCVVGVLADGLIVNERQLTVLLDDGRVMANVLSFGPKGRMPSFLTNRSIIRDLQRFLLKTACG